MWHLFLTVLEAGCPRPKLSVVTSWWMPPSIWLHGQWHLPLPRAAGGTGPVVSLIKALIRPWGLWPHHPTASQRNPIKGYASAHESGGDTHTHTTVTNRLSFSSICGLEFPCIVYPFIFYDSIFITLFYCSISWLEFINPPILSPLFQSWCLHADKAVPFLPNFTNCSAMPLFTVFS